jgi:hypothetical protein
MISGLEGIAEYKYGECIYKMMEQNIIDIFYLEKKGIKGYASIKEFIEKIKQREIYMVDTNSFRGRDINLKLLSKLTSVYDIWFESNIRWKDDVYDIILTGAKIAVLGGRKVDEKFLYSIIEVTDNIALKSNDENLLKIFISLGGKIVITDLEVDAPKRFRVMDGRLVEK